LAGLAGAPAGGPALGGPGLRGRGGAALPGTRTRREDPGRAPGARVCRWRRAPGRKRRHSWAARRVLVLSPPPARTAASRSGRGGLGAAAACGALRAVPRARRARGAAGGRRSVPLVLRRDGEVVRMSQRRFGLRLRMLATLTGAGLLCGAVLTVVLLLGVRDEITRRHVGSARAGIRAVGESAARHCGRDAACFSGAVAVAGLTWQEGASCGTPLRIAERLVACEEVRGGALRQEVDLAPAAAQARSLIGPVLVSVLLGMLLLVVLVSWVLDRQLVAPLVRVDEALDRVSDGASFGPLLAEGGDFLGRLAPAVNRLDLRLREERARVQTQIEELQASNRELRAAREEVVRSERLASVGRLAAGVAHEVGNPMPALLGFLSILQDRLKQGKDPGDYLDRLSREAERIDRILRDLLGLARPPARDLQPVDLRAAAERARGLLEAQPSWTGCALELR